MESNREVSRKYFPEFIDNVVWKLTGKIRCSYCGKYYRPLLSSKDSDKMLLIKMSFCSRNCEISDTETNQSINEFLKKFKFIR